MAGNMGAVQKPQQSHHQQHRQSPEKYGEKPDLLLVGAWIPFLPHGSQPIENEGGWQTISVPRYFQWHRASGDSLALA
jgi:hypothetical protein